MKTQQLILLILFLPLFSLSQNHSNFGRTYSDNLPDNFKIDVPEMREHIYSGIPAELKEGNDPRSSYRFADQSTIATHRLFSSGMVYSDWESLERYLNDILQKVMPKELADDELIHAYIVKDGSYNAFMIPSGMMFVHIGLFDLVESEAALASIIAHELAHYYLKHSVKQYVKEEQGKFRPGFLMKNKHARKNFSIDSELEADALSMEWMTQAGYNIKGMIQSFEATERLEKNRLSRSKTRWEIKETTHPRSEKRLKKIEDFIAEEQPEGSSYFIVSKEKFAQYKEKAKPEILKHLLNDFEYSSCIEKAFKYHIYQPENAVYIYYLMEAIRRKCYLDTGVWSKNFITNRYYKIVETKKTRYKERVTDHIFSKVPTDILCLSESEANNIKAKFYWDDEVKFKTYEQAFVFFNQIAELYEERECILSNALSVSFDKKVMNKYLEEYLSHDDIRYKTYATHLLNDDIKKTLKNEKLTLLSNFIVRLRNGKEEISLMDTSDKNAAYLKKMLTSAADDFEHRKLVYLSDLRDNELNDYTMLKELESLSFATIFAKGEKTELHILDPRYWEIMNQLGVNEIEFVNCVFLDIRKPDTSLENYKTLINTDLNQLLAETKRNRYLDVFVTSVRIIEDGVMKIKYYGAEDKLAYKKEGYEQVVELINSRLKKKDVKATELDTP